jgi:putative transposase
MSLAVSPSAGKPYGLARVCRIWRLARSTVYFQRRCGTRTNGARRGPVGPCPDDQLIGHIRSVITGSPFHGEGYRKVWARLRFKGTRTSPRRVLRLMQEHDLLAPRRVKHHVGRKAHDGKIITEGVNQMWGIDQTSCLTTDEGQVAIFFAVDHCSMECVGIHAAKCGTRFEALEPIRQGVRDYFGDFSKDIAKGLSLRHDHGSQFVSGLFQEELAFLGVKSSPAFVHQPQGNGCAERFVRILKENLLWLRPFRDTEQLRQALLEFKGTYNQCWILQRHGYKTPAQIRTEQIALLLKVA